MAESLAAAEKLAADGVNAKVINIHTIKSFSDEELVVACSKGMWQGGYCGGALCNRRTWSRGM